MALENNCSVRPGAQNRSYSVRCVWDNVAAAKRELLRRFIEQQMNGYEIEYVVAASSQEAARLNLPDDCIVLLAQSPGDGTSWG